MLCQILRLGSPTSHLEMDTLDNAVRLSTRTVDQLMTLLKLTILQVIGNSPLISLHLILPSQLVLRKKMSALYLKLKNRDIALITIIITIANVQLENWI